MPIDLSKPLTWTNATHDEQRALGALQGNILKGHGRAATVNLFFSIAPAKKHEMRAALRELANYHVTNAYQQLLATKAFQDHGIRGDVFVSLYLSATGYAALGVPAASVPGDPSFKKGMQKATLGDPPVADWEIEFRGQIDGMVLVASEDDTDLRRKRDAVATLLTDAGATIVKEQKGKAIFNEAHVGIEHFGYVDGRSQPLLLTEDVDKEFSPAAFQSGIHRARSMSL